jgi:hypothetical protein
MACRAPPTQNPRVPCQPARGPNYAPRKPSPLPAARLVAPSYSISVCLTMACTLQQRWAPSPHSSSTSPPALHRGWRQWGQLRTCCHRVCRYCLRTRPAISSYLQSTTPPYCRPPLPCTSACPLPFPAASCSRRGPLQNGGSRASPRLECRSRLPSSTRSQWCDCEEVMCCATCYLRH